MELGITIYTSFISQGRAWSGWLGRSVSFLAHPRWWWGCCDILKKYITNTLKMMTCVKMALTKKDSWSYGRLRSD